MKNLRRKIIFIALIVDVIVVLVLSFFYLGSYRDVLSAKNTEVAGSETALPIPDEISQLSGSILVDINPDPITSFFANPGIGWQHDIHDSSNYLPETVAYSVRNEISWDILNPAPDLYNWSPLDEQLSSAVAEGKLYSFRVYTMSGETFGGHKVPQWVLDQGAKLMSTGEPDYSNCVYQEEWGKFVEALVDRYDGNPAIAFIDISGYGNFNEWSWQDEQTNWDDHWEENYTNGTETPATMKTLDSQARRRLADMFIGGSFEGHQCRNMNNAVQTVNYSYRGFTSTQLVMPFAGIAQSTQYVFSRRPDAGFRYDSLGRENSSSVGTVTDEISQLWKNAPVVFELSKPEEFKYGAASQLLETTHASLVHNNDYQQSKEFLEKLVIQAGYRYSLKHAQIRIEPHPTGRLELDMTWQNIGDAPNYPRMGQNFQLHLYLVDQRKRVLADYPVDADISEWMPADSVQAQSPEYRVRQIFLLPDKISPGDYSLMVSIIDTSSGNPINLAFSGDDGSGKYWLADINIMEK